MRTLHRATPVSRFRPLIAGAPLPAGIAMLRGFIAVFVAVVPLEYARSVLSGAEAAAVMAAVVAGASWRSGAAAAAGIAGMGWLMLDGFVVHQYGDIGWDGAPDVVRVAALLVAAVLASTLHAALLWVRRPRRPLRWSAPRPRSPQEGRMRYHTRSGQAERDRAW